MDRKIERIGNTTGRWVKYNLIVDGVDVGEVKRSLAGGGDRMQPGIRYDVWRIHGRAVCTQEEAERVLIERAVRFGNLT